MSDKLLQKFESALIDQDIALRTRKTYLSDLSLFFRWYEGEYGCFKLKQVTTEQIAAYRSWKLSYCKPSTTNRHIVTLKRFFSWAVDEGRVKQSPARKIKFVPEVKPAPRQLSDIEEDRMIAAARRHGSARDLALMLTMFHTGLRAMEVCNLRVEDIRISEASGTLEVKRGKRNKFRVIPLNASVRDVLRGWVGDRCGGWLFPNSRTGNRLGERGLGYLIKKYAALAGVLDVSPHDLRHRFAYAMVAAGVKLHVLQRIMGHEDISMTAHYAQPTADDLQAATEMIA